MCALNQGATTPRRHPTSSPGLDLSFTFASIHSFSCNAATTPSWSDPDSIMADEDVATRAPESDAQEVSAIPGDSKVDQNAATMGVSCYHNTSYRKTVNAKPMDRSTAQPTAQPVILPNLPPKTPTMAKQADRHACMQRPASTPRAYVAPTSLAVPNGNAKERPVVGNDAIPQNRRLHRQTRRLPALPLQTPAPPHRRHGRAQHQQPAASR